MVSTFIYNEGVTKHLRDSFFPLIFEGCISMGIVIFQPFIFTIVDYNGKLVLIDHKTLCSRVLLENVICGTHMQLDVALVVLVSPSFPELLLHSDIRTY